MFIARHWFGRPNVLRIEDFQKIILFISIAYLNNNTRHEFYSKPYYPSKSLQEAPFYIRRRLSNRLTYDVFVIMVSNEEVESTGTKGYFVL